MAISSSYRIARAGQPSREMTLEEINRALAAGELSATDTYWREGMPKWEPLRALPGLIFPKEGAAPSGLSGAVATSSPPDVFANRANEAATSVWGAATPYAYPAIWSPAAITLVSLLFTPVFGSTLIRLNCRAAGRPERGKMAALWSVFSSLMLVALWAAPPLLHKSMNTWFLMLVVYFSVWLVWALGNAWPHARFLFSEIGPRRRPAPWGWPLVCGAAGVLAWAGVLGFLSQRFG